MKTFAPLVALALLGCDDHADDPTANVNLPPPGVLTELEWGLTQADGVSLRQTTHSYDVGGQTHYTLEWVDNADPTADRDTILFSRSGKVWNSDEATFAKRLAAQGYRVFAPAYRGTSFQTVSGNNYTSPGTFELCQGEIDDAIALLEILGPTYASTTQMGLVGASTGGCVTLGILRDADPELIPIDAAVPLYPITDAASVYAYAGGSSIGLLGTLAFCDALGPFAAFNQGCVKAYSQAAARSVLSDACGLAANNAGPVSPASAPACYDALSPVDDAEDISANRVPTLLVHGTKDWAVKDDDTCAFADAARTISMYRRRHTGGVAAAWTADEICNSSGLTYDASLPSGDEWAGSSHLIIQERLPHALTPVWNNLHGMRGLVETGLDDVIFEFLEANLDEDNAPAVCQDANTVAPTDPDVLAAFDQAEDLYDLHAATASAHPPGMVVGIEYQGQTYVKAFGFEDPAETIPLTSDARFDLGSTQKSFRSILMKRLAEHPAYDMDMTDPLDDHLEGNDFAGTGITIEHLQNHSSGIIPVESTCAWKDVNSSIPGNNAFPPKQFDREEMIPSLLSMDWDCAGPTCDNLVDNCPSDPNHLPGVTIEPPPGPATGGLLDGAVPGADSWYTSFGSMINGYVTEDLTGVPVLEMQRRLVHQPLGMGDTTYMFYEVEPEEVVPGFDSGQCERQISENYEYTESFSSSQGYGNFSSACDLLAYAQGIMDDEDFWAHGGAFEDLLPDPSFPGEVGGAKPGLGVLDYSPWGLDGWYGHGGGSLYAHGSIVVRRPDSDPNDGVEDGITLSVLINSEERYSDCEDFCSDPGAYTDPDCPVDAVFLEDWCVDGPTPPPSATCTKAPISTDPSFPFRLALHYDVMRQVATSLDAL